MSSLKPDCGSRNGLIRQFVAQTTPREFPGLQQTENRGPESQPSGSEGKRNKKGGKEGRKEDAPANPLVHHILKVHRCRILVFSLLLDSVPRPRGREVPPLALFFLHTPPPSRSRRRLTGSGTRTPKVLRERESFSALSFPWRRLTGSCPRRRSDLHCSRSDQASIQPSPCRGRPGHRQPQIDCPVLVRRG